MTRLAGLAREVTGMGHSGAAAARFLGVTTSAVNRVAASPPLPETARFPRRLSHSCYGTDVP